MTILYGRQDEIETLPNENDSIAQNTLLPYILGSVNSKEATDEQA